MKKIKRRTKRSYFGYIFTFASILVVFLIIPQVLFMKSAKLMKTERAIKENVPPSANFYIAKNYLDLVSFFPGFTKKSKEIVDDATLFYIGKYINASSIKKDSIIDNLIAKTRIERDSVFDNSNIYEHKNISQYYDSIEQHIFDIQWIETYKNKNEFCEIWTLFFEKTELKMSDYSIICN